MILEYFYKSLEYWIVGLIFSESKTCFQFPKWLHTPEMAFTHFWKDGNALVAFG
jgi:hypothetical protein